MHQADRADDAAHADLARLILVGRRRVSAVEMLSAEDVTYILARAPADTRYQPVLREAKRTGDFEPLRALLATVWCERTQSHQRAGPSIEDIGTAVCGRSAPRARRPGAP